MKPEAQWIAIAEACGWRNPNHEETQKLVDTWWSKDRNVWWLPPDRATLVMVSSVPNYIGSLDAMHEAEMTLTEDQHAEFRGWLFQSRPYHLGVSATAAQRAEAFLKCLNLWTT